jgi:hypothetical protein
MAGRLTPLAALLLASVVSGGTGLYILGITPPYPWNAWIFNLMVVVCLLFAIVFGR